MAKTCGTTQEGLEEGLVETLVMCVSSINPSPSSGLRRFGGSKRISFLRRAPALG
jgi:hypothetical protein